MLCGLGALLSLWTIPYLDEIGGDETRSCERILAAFATEDARDLKVKNSYVQITYKLCRNSYTMHCRYKKSFDLNKSGQ